MIFPVCQNNYLYHDFKYQNDNAFYKYLNKIKILYILEKN